MKTNVTEGTEALVDGVKAEVAPVEAAAAIDESQLFNIQTYLLPEGCTYDDLSLKVCCIKSDEDHEDDHSICYTMEQLNQVYSMDLAPLCQEIQSGFNKCKENEDLQKCFSEELLSFAVAQDQVRYYGWLAFDDVHVNKLLDGCKALPEQAEEFGVTFEDMEKALSADYGMYAPAEGW